MEHTRVEGKDFFVYFARKGPRKVKQGMRPLPGVGQA